MTKIAADTYYLCTLFLVGFNFMIDYVTIKSVVLFISTFILIWVRIIYYIKCSKKIEEGNKKYNESKKNKNLGITGKP